MSTPTYTYERFEHALSLALDDLRILSGEDVGDAAWQDVAGTCAVNLRHAASLLDAARAGRIRSVLLFPSVDAVCGTGD